MNKILIFSIVIIFLLLLSCLIFKEKSKKENIKTAKLSTKLSAKLEPKIHHNFDTGCYPRLPRPLYSEHHHITIKQNLNNSKKCNRCTESNIADLENKIVDITKSYIQNQVDYETTIKNLNSLHSNETCETCNKLFETWNRYLNSVKAIKQYEKNGELPSFPKSEKYKCKGCSDVETKKKEYAKKLLKEVQHVIKKEPFEKIGIPKFNYNKVNCKDCFKVYVKWANYIMPMIDIENYIECTNNVKLNHKQ